MFLRISIVLTGLVLIGTSISGVLYLKKSNINSTGVEEGVVNTTLLDTLTRK